MTRSGFERVCLLALNSLELPLKKSSSRGACRTPKSRKSVAKFSRPDDVTQVMELSAMIDLSESRYYLVTAFLRLESSRSEEHTSELQSLMRISYAVFCLKKKNTT